MKYLKYFFLVVIVNIVILDMTYLLFRRGYNKYNKYEQSRLNFIINGKEYHDALFIGSSRTFYHINPLIIDSILKLNSYNAGMDGARLTEFGLILKCYLADHPQPKYLIMDISPPSFDVDNDFVFNPNVYYPFLDNEIVFNTLKPVKRVHLLKNIPFLQITECDDVLRQGAFEGLLGHEKKLEPHYKGHLESGPDTVRLPFKATYMVTDFPISKTGTAALEEIIRICKSREIKLFITYSPVYKLRDEKLNEMFFPTLEKICDTSHTPFLTYRYLSINSSHRLFRDEMHLNKRGADIFSRILANDLKRQIAN